MAINYSSNTKLLSEHLIDAANGITQEVADRLMEPIMEKIEAAKAAFDAAMENYDEEYLEMFRTAVLPKGRAAVDNDVWLDQDWEVIRKLMGGIRTHDLYLGYDYTVGGEAGYSGKLAVNTPSLRLGEWHADFPSLFSRNPFEKAANKYIFGGVSNTDEIRKKGHKVLKDKALSALKNCNLVGVTNYIYNQYIKGTNENPFVKGLLSLDILVDEDVIGLYLGIADGTGHAIPALKDAIRSMLSHVQSTGNVNTLRESFVSKSRSHFERTGEFSELCFTYMEQVVEDWRNTGHVTVSSFDHYWSKSALYWVDKNLLGDERTELLRYVWNEVLTQDQRDTGIYQSVLGRNSAFYAFDPECLRLRDKGAYPSIFSEVLTDMDIQGAVDRLPDIEVDDKGTTVIIPGCKVVGQPDRLYLNSREATIGVIDRPTALEDRPRVMLVQASHFNPAKGQLAFAEQAKKIAACVQDVDRYSEVIGSSDEVLALKDFVDATESNRFVDNETVATLRHFVNQIIEPEDSEYEIIGLSVNSRWNSPDYAATFNYSSNTLLRK